MFHLSRKIYVAVVLIAVIVLATVGVYIYNSMSVESVRGIALNQIQAVRVFTSGTYPNRNATFIIEVQVWSKAQSVAVRLNDPTFLVDLSPSVRGNQTLPGGTILPGSYLTYNLRFNLNESSDIVTVSFPNATVLVEMNAMAQSTLYSQHVTVGDEALWDWTSAKLIKNYG